MIELLCLSCLHLSLIKISLSEPVIKHYEHILLFSFICHVPLHTISRSSHASKTPGEIHVGWLHINTYTRRNIELSFKYKYNVPIVLLAICNLDALPIHVPIVYEIKHYLKLYHSSWIC